MQKTINIISKPYCRFCGESIGSHQCGWSSGPYDAGMGFHVDGSGPIHGRFQEATGKPLETPNYSVFDDDDSDDSDKISEKCKQNMMQTFPDEFTYTKYKYTTQVQITEEDKQEFLMSDARQTFYNTVVGSKSRNDDRPHLQFKSGLSENSKSQLMKEIYKRFPNIEVQVEDEITSYDPNKSYPWCCAIYVYLG